MAKKKKQQEKKDKTLITYVTAIGIILLLFVALFQLGIIGIVVNNFIRFLFGDYYYAICLLIIGTAVVILWDKQNHRKMKLMVAVSSVIMAIVLWGAIQGNPDRVGLDVLENFLSQIPAYFDSASTTRSYGGLIGSIVYSLTSLLIAKEGTWFLIVGLVLLAALLTLTLEVFRDALHSVKGFFALPKQWRDELSNGENEDFSDYDEEDEVIDEEESVEETASVIEKFEGKKKTLFMDIDEVGYGTSLSEEKIIEKTNRDVTKSSESSNGPINEPKNNRAYRLPPTSLLVPAQAKNKNNANEVVAKEKGSHLISILSNFGINAELLATHIGPSVTKFELKPDTTVKVSKINSITDNIKMELAARDIRIEAPIPGRNAVGIEIPNVESTAVQMSSLIRKVPNELRDKKTLIALGKDLMGQPVYCDMHRMPHLLIAGATGSGKSVCMNTIITSLLLRTKPDEVKLLLVDPKKVEFTPYQRIPHLIGPVISDAAEASKALKVVVEKMEERYDAFSKAGVRNIDSFNEKVKNSSEDLKPMPYIIVIIDELADLMAIAGKEVEMSIQRITQLARAAGIHLIVATQRPSTDVITGIIKANIPSRIAFSVSSGIDSRTILDTVGAERLLGNGDMLYQPIGAPSPTRLQGAYVSDEEVSKIAEFCSSQATPLFEDAFIQLDGVESNETTSVMKAEDDPLYEEIKEYVIEVQKASTSLLQRRFGIGYNRAARMVDILEDRGIVGPAQGSKPRDVYIKKEE